MGPVTEEEISDFIAMDFRADRRLAGTSMETRIQDGIAELSGVALSLDQVERAVARILAVDGVRAVVNRVRIVRAVAEDGVLRERVTARLESHPAVDSTGIRAEVSDGALVLSGEVGTWDEQDLARELASEVPGIQEIEERLEVNFEGRRSDEEIRWQILHHVGRDPHFEGLPIQVTVSSGVVRLSGETGTSGERERLFREAHVTGVSSVEADELLVNSDLAMEAMSGKTPTDDEMLEAFRDALAMDPRVSDGAVTARCRDGMLFLTGTLGSRAERNAVLGTARGTAGVIRVVSELEIGEESPRFGEVTNASPKAKLAFWRKR